MTNADRAAAAKAVFANGETRLLIPVPIQGLKGWNARIVRKAAA